MLVNLIFASELPPTSLEHSKLVRERDLPSVLQGSSLFQERFVLLPERENQIPVLYQLTIKNKVLYLIKFNITLILLFFKNIPHFLYPYDVSLAFPYPNQQNYPLVRFQEKLLLLSISSFDNKHISYLHSILLAFLVTVNTLHFLNPLKLKTKNQAIELYFFLRILDFIKYMTYIFHSIIFLQVVEDVRLINTFSVFIHKKVKINKH